jgi:hypothetical protein
MAEGVAASNNLGWICCGSQLSGRGVVLLWLVDHTRSVRIHYGIEGVWARVCNYPLRGFWRGRQVLDGKSLRSDGRKGARRRRGWSVTQAHATRCGSSTPRDQSRQRKGLPWSETRHDGDGEQLGARCKAEGFDDEARVVGVDEVVCARVPESERVHGLARRSRASAERVLLTTGFRPRQAERRSGSAHTCERVHWTRARRAKATAWSSACTSVRP